MFPDGFKQQAMVNVIKESFDVELQHPVISPAALARCSDCSYG
jgi:hypothetical protein